MLVMNPMTADSRVDREATALAEAGHQVIVVATAADGLPTQEARAGFTILRLPYRRVLRDRFRGYARSQTGESRRRIEAFLAASSASSSNGRLAEARHLLAAATPYMCGKAVWATGGAALKTMRSAVTPHEYWLGLAARIPGLLQRCDVVHAHDLVTLAAAVRLAQHWARRVRSLPRPRIIYDSHELFVEQTTKWRRREKALWALHERRWIRHADLILTVSPGIARELQRRYGLAEEPTVLYNVPDLSRTNGSVGDVRTDLGLGPEVPLIVYAGTVKPQRGVDTAVEALSSPGTWHLVLVGPGGSPHVRDLLASATRAGTARRLHVLPAVPAGDLPRYLRTADLGIHPLDDSCRNHELALPNKLFDYLYAGLPIAVSRLQEMTAFVERHGVGVTFTPRDPAAVASAVNEALSTQPRIFTRGSALSTLHDVYAWRSQRAKLIGSYEQLLSDAEQEGHAQPRKARPQRGAPRLALGRRCRHRPSAGHERYGLAARGAEKATRLRVGVAPPPIGTAGSPGGQL